MKREDLLAVLPCYECGDLPPHVREAVRGLVESDAEAAARLAALSTSQSTCQEALRRAAPALVRIERARAAAVTRRPASAAWAVLLALGVLLSLRALTGPYGPTPTQEMAAQLDTWTALQPRALPGFVASDDPQVLSRALREAGALGEDAELSPVRAEGVSLAGAAPVPGGGFVLLFVDAEGRAYRCFSVPERALPEVDAIELPGAPAGAPALRSFAWAGERAVSWTTRGRLCVLISAAPRALVERLARAKVWGARS